ncbi:MAG: sulfatase-like hydrolase/transferase, partial [Candidatus Sumerlaeia bacterium]
MSKKRPNILITFSDDQPYYDISGLGNTEIRTPVQERMMERGTCFERVYHGGSTTGAVCCPSRAQLFTGMPVMQIPNVMKNWWEDDADKFEAPNPDPACMPLLGEELRKSGYYCYGTGKWHNFPFSYIRNFNDGGAIYFCGGNPLQDRLKKMPHMPYGKYGSPRPDEVGRGGHFNKPLHVYDGTGEYSPFLSYTEPRHSTDAFSESAIHFLDNYKDDKPFFLYVAFTAPHGPMKTYQSWHDQYPADKVSLPPNFTPCHAWDNGGFLTQERLDSGFAYTEEESRESIADLYAITAHEDEAIGQIQDALDRNGFADNTIVIHTGDHGKSLGHHGLQGKYSLYEHSIAVPLLMYGPGIPKGEVRRQLAYQHDLFPFILEQAGLEIPETTGYDSIGPLVQDGDNPGREYIGTLFKDTQRMIRDRRWKLIAYHVNGEKHIQLFDMEKDPHELENLAGQADKTETIDR